VTRPKKGGKSDRSASVPSPITTSGEVDRQPARPMRGLEFLDGVLGNSTKTRNLIWIVGALTVGLATIIAVIGVVLVKAPSEHLQLIATVLLSSASTALMGTVGIWIRGRRNRSAGSVDASDDTDSND
jgi:hypothetical protein